MDVRYFPLGVLNFVLFVIALIWLFSVRGVFKNQISLQRKLFLFIAINCLCRSFQNALFPQICFDGRERESYCTDFVLRVQLVFDILGSANNFTVYLILSSFW